MSLSLIARATLPGNQTPCGCWLCRLWRWALNLFDCKEGRIGMNFGSYKTTTAGIFGILCVAVALLAKDEEVRRWAMGLGTTIIGGGLIAARDNNVTSQQVGAAVPENISTDIKVEGEILKPGQVK